MKLERAIEILETTGDEFFKIDPHEIDGAERLSIEALQAIKKWRAESGGYRQLLLPSEILD